MKVEITGIGGDVYLRVKTLLETPAGTVVNDRKYGIDWSGVDYPPEIAEAMLAGEVEEKLEQYEPEVTIEDILTSFAEDGTLAIKVVLSNGD